MGQVHLATSSLDHLTPVDELFTDQIVNLMYQDSLITEYVIKKFTYSDVPILSFHDSFIIQYDQVLNLKKYMSF